MVSCAAPSAGFPFITLKNAVKCDSFNPIDKTRAVEEKNVRPEPQATPACRRLKNTKGDEDGEIHRQIHEDIAAH